MTRDDIIRMARKAGFSVGVTDPVIYAAHERFFNAAYAAGATAEREACAKVCDEAHERFKKLWGKFDYPEDEGRMDGANQCAAAIRARSN